ncbi:MAG: hypothetical protein EA376_11365 [Phycisphaeraceae bacterium]|nr:MAG: hypothetical protein EA376_11365 [Phycisphaeraceae bacterium]
MDHRPLPYQRDDLGGPGPVVTISLEQPDRKALVMDRALLARLDATLDDLGENIGGLVIASDSARVFVAGADLKEIDGLDDSELDAYLAYGQQVFGRIAALPYTSVAAVDGAALGGGLELAMHCDVLLGLRPKEGERAYPIGLVEATLGICPGWGGTNLLPARIEPGQAIGMTASGATMIADEAMEMGLFESLHDSREALLEAARSRAAQRKPERSDPRRPRCVSQREHVDDVRKALERVKSELPEGDAASAIADCVRAGVNGDWDHALAMERRSLIRLRKTEKARASIKAFFDRSASR